MIHANTLSIKLVEVINQLQGIAKDNAADAVNLGVSAIKIAGIQNILDGLLFLAVAIIAGRIAWRYYKLESGMEWHLKEQDFKCYFAAAASLLSGIISFCCLGSIWTYIAIFEPKLWLAHQVIAKLG